MRQSVVITDQQKPRSSLPRRFPPSLICTHSVSAFVSYHIAHEPGCPSGVTKVPKLFKKQRSSQHSLYSGLMLADLPWHWDLGF